MNVREDWQANSFYKEPKSKKKKIFFLFFFFGGGGGGGARVNEEGIDCVKWATFALLVSRTGAVG